MTILVILICLIVLGYIGYLQYDSDKKKWPEKDEHAKLADPVDHSNGN